MNKKLKLSFNGRLIDKIDPYELRFFAAGFESMELTLDDLEENIRLGFAFSYQFEGGYRRSENFLASDILVVDIDGGLKIGETLEYPVVSNYASFLYTTHSHDEDHHRFRLVFGLPRTLTDPNELRFANRALATQLGGDTRHTHAAGLFLGNSKCFSKQLDSGISDDFLNELISHGRDVVASESIANRSPTANRSSFKIAPTHSIQLANGVRTTLRQIEDKRPVFCPFHRDDEPTAFVAQSKNGRFLHCQECNKSWWMSGARQPVDTFNDFDAVIKVIKAGGVEKSAEELTPLEDAMGGVTIDSKNILIANERHLNGANLKRWDLSQGVTLVKSPKGSGKTTFLSHLVRLASTNFLDLEELEEESDPEAPSPWYSEEKILLIGHRQALIGELCERLQLNCYLDDLPNSSDGILRERKRRYGVCLDSLKKVERIQYDIVVIDEVEQVLAHFLSDTVGEARRQIFRIFERVIWEARQVIVLDADLGWPTYKTLELLKSATGKGIGKDASAQFTSDLKVYLNEWQDGSRNINVYANEGHLLHELKVALLAGERVFICSNSKKKVQAIEQVVKKIARTTGTQIRHLSITSENSKSVKVQELIKNIKERILDYEVVLSSPSLGTGVDISFDDGAQHIDRVFGFFEQRITTHFEIDQQLARVRNPKQIDVWISPQKFNFETEFQIVVDDLVRSDFVNSVQQGLGWVDPSVMAAKDPFLAMAALVTTKSRRSKNQLKANFVQHKRDQGWSVNHIEKLTVPAASGLWLMEEGKQLRSQVEAERLLTVQPLNQYELKILEERSERPHEIITLEEQSRIERTFLELFYLEDATVELIAKDNNGRFRECVRRFEVLLDAKDALGRARKKMQPLSSKTHTRASVKLIQDRDVGGALLHELLHSTPIYEEGKFLTDVRYSSADLGEFAATSVRLKAFMEGQFSLLTRRDVDKKPTQHLGAILKLVGLEQVKFGKNKIEGTTVYYYRVKKSRLEALEDLAMRRAQTKPWEYMNQRYGFQYSDAEVAFIASSA